MQSDRLQYDASTLWTLLQTQVQEGPVLKPKFPPSHQNLRWIVGTHISGYLHLSQASFILILVISNIGPKVLFSFIENKITGPWRG